MFCGNLDVEPESSLGFASNDQFAPRVGIAEDIAEAFPFRLDKLEQRVLAYVGRVL